MPYKAMRVAVTKSPGRATRSITYCTTNGVRDRGHQARIVTEGVMFDVTARLVLMEVAPGIDMHHGVLDHIGLEVRQAEQLTTMDAGQLRPCLQTG
jgi:acyl CoA:acetate/3-ketoacid CoA transferase